MQERSVCGFVHSFELSSAFSLLTGIYHRVLFVWEEHLLSYHIYIYIHLKMAHTTCHCDDAVHTDCNHLLVGDSEIQNIIVNWICVHSKIGITQLLLSKSLIQPMIFSFSCIIILTMFVFWCVFCCELCSFWWNYQPVELRLNDIN